MIEDACFVCEMRVNDKKMAFLNRFNGRFSELK